MNELIMAALENAKIQFSSFTMGDKEMILDVVKFACEAQRNACARVYERDYIDKGGYNIHDYIASAEIERCDYE